jgi:hypothetical protein
LDQEARFERNSAKAEGLFRPLGEVGHAGIITGKPIYRFGPEGRAIENEDVRKGGARHEDQDPTILLRARKGNGFAVRPERIDLALLAHNDGPNGVRSENPVAVQQA